MVGGNFGAAGVVPLNRYWGEKVTVSPTFQAGKSYARRMGLWG